MASTSEIKEHVRNRYGELAEQASSCCGAKPQDAMSKRVGYSEEELAAVPEGANLGLGCGNPLALAGIEEGSTVLDLGSGAGFDCFLAAKRVGESGHVIGVDMTDAMLEKARANGEKGGYTNVEFRKGDIEALPVDDNSIDVITSNCVINLSPEKAKVFAEAYRVLKPGGRAFISDIVLLRPLPDSIAESVAAYTACVGGAVLKDDYMGAMKSAGFSEAIIASEAPFGGRGENVEELIAESGWLHGLENAPKEDLIDAAGSVVSIRVELRK